MNEISGIWDCIIVVPVGKEPAELAIQLAPDGGVTGTLTNLKDNQSVELKDGRFDGKRLSWTMQLIKPFKLTVKSDVEIEGNTLSGQGSTAMLGTVAITGTKRA